MKTTCLHSKTRTVHFRVAAGVLALLIAVAFSTPTFAACACCEEMASTTLEQVVAADTEEAAPPCHASVPIETKSAECHEEASTTSAQPSSDVIMGCQFECMQSISMTGLIADKVIPAPKPTETNSLANNFTSLSIVGTLSHAVSSAYESPPSLSALDTRRYSTILPPRI